MEILKPPYVFAILNIYESTIRMPILSSHLIPYVQVYRASEPSGRYIADAQRILEWGAPIGMQTASLLCDKTRYMHAKPTEEKRKKREEDYALLSYVSSTSKKTCVPVGLAIGTISKRMPHVALAGMVKSAVCAPCVLRSRTACCAPPVVALNTTRLNSEKSLQPPQLSFTLRLN